MIPAPRARPVRLRFRLLGPPRTWDPAPRLEATWGCAPISGFGYGGGPFFTGACPAGATISGDSCTGGETTWPLAAFGGASNRWGRTLLVT